MLDFGGEIQKERHHYENLDMDGMIILKCNLEKYDEVLFTLLSLSSKAKLLLLFLLT
jgi:hypothetical protein